MSLWVLGLNHQTAPVELRERVSFAGEALPAALASLRAHPQVEEAVLLSTCNRTELYAVTDDPDSLNHWLNEQAGNLDGHLYQLGQDEAVRHLFRVATGLDSMVLGEPQILGQVKDAWGAAPSAHAPIPALAPTRFRWPRSRYAWHRNPSCVWMAPPCCWWGPARPWSWWPNI